MELSTERMYQAIVEKDAGFDGVFFTCVKTTGIFCRPVCTARKPKPENVEFTSTSKDALAKGYRPCKICEPMKMPDETPGFIQSLLDEVKENPSVKIGDWALTQRGLEPYTVRRWFLKHHGMTFHAYQRMYRLNMAYRKLQAGEPVTHTAYDAGFESLSGFGDSFKSVFGVSPNQGKTQRVIDLTRLETPLGPMLACAVEEGVCLLEFTDRRMLETEFKALKKHYKAVILQGDNPHFKLLKTELAAYFAGELRVFKTPLAMPGSAFQQAAWQALLQTPYGQTRSYAEQAAVMGRPDAFRAVASANGMNRISIIVPCHRLVGSDGHLTGYGGGLWRKKWLIDFEREHA